VVASSASPSSRRSSRRAPSLVGLRVAPVEAAVSLVVLAWASSSNSSSLVLLASNSLLREALARQPSRLSSLVALGASVPRISSSSSHLVDCSEEPNNPQTVEASSATQVPANLHLALSAVKASKAVGTPEPLASRPSSRLAVASASLPKLRLALANSPSSSSLPQGDSLAELEGYSAPKAQVSSSQQARALGSLAALVGLDSYRPLKMQPQGDLLLRSRPLGNLRIRASVEPLMPGVAVGVPARRAVASLAVRLNSHRLRVLLEVLVALNSSSLLLPLVVLQLAVRAFSAPNSPNSSN
jgi:hypothetical protein